LTLPVADTLDPKGIQTDFYKDVFGINVPFKNVSNWNELDKLVPRLLDQYPNNMHQVVCWWIKEKRNIGIKIMRQINA
jgi:hypothetical protein